MNTKTALSSMIVQAIRALLAKQPTSRQHLLRHAGKRVLISFPVDDLLVQVTEDGNLENTVASDDFQPDVSITLRPELIIRMALGDKHALSGAGIVGDGVLANDLSTALEAFDWVLALRPFVGDIAATRANQFLGGLSGWRNQVHDAFGRAVSEYAAYEADLVANSNILQKFSDDVDALRDDAARLDARIALLEGTR